MNLDRFCAGASQKQREAFKNHYESTRSQAKRIKELGLEKAPNSPEELNSLLKNKEVIEGEVVAQTDQGAFNKHRDKLSARIKELQAENDKLREELRKLRGSSAKP